MKNFTAHISEKTVEQAKKGFFTIKVPLTMTSGEVKNVLIEGFKLSALEIRMITKKTISRKKGSRIVKDRGFKKAVIKLSPAQVFPGYETFLSETKDGKKEDKKEAKKKIVTKSKDA